MAKVKIQGHASGTGILTLTAPNTSTDRTITLPDSTGTLATTADVPSSITDNGDATAITIDSNENVGIGITSPLDILHLNDPDDDCVINLDTAQANKNSIVKFSDPDAQGRGMIQYNHTTDSLRTTVAGTERTRIHSNGVLTVPAGIALGVAATSNASSNTLDDYEEGTWTPSITASNGGSSMTYSGSNSGSYVKIGNLVTIFGMMQLTDKGNLQSGSLQLKGFPFNISSVTHEGQGGVIVEYANFSVNFNSPIIAKTTTEKMLIRYTSADGSSAYQNATGDHVNDNTYIRFFATYGV